MNEQIQTAMHAGFKYHIGFKYRSFPCVKFVWSFTCDDPNSHQWPFIWIMSRIKCSNENGKFYLFFGRLFACAAR